MSLCWKQGEWSLLAKSDDAIAPLAQGDLLPDCPIPYLDLKYVGEISEGATLEDMSIRDANLIVMTHSCDIANGKAPVVVLCVYGSLLELESQQPALKKKGAWEEIRKGRREFFHMLPCPTDPQDNRGALVVDFRFVVTLPIEYVLRHAEVLGARWRLESPYIENLSQAFGRYFMRVGLPRAIPSFN